MGIELSAPVYFIIITIQVAVSVVFEIATGIILAMAWEISYFPSTEKEMIKTFHDNIQESKKLFVSEKGVVGMACAGARCGDSIWFWMVVQKLWFFALSAMQLLRISIGLPAKLLWG
jgi:hypothetical protein